jgi:predicted nucleic acid-binding protein
MAGRRSGVRRNAATSPGDPELSRLLDASVWIDFTRARSPRLLKEFIAPFVLDTEACLAEPVAFEVLRYADADEARQLYAQFQSLPMLPTPLSLWADALALGQRCRRQGLTPGALDLLIASVAIHHDSELITFDRDFCGIARVSLLRVKHLRRPTT